MILTEDEIKQAVKHISHNDLTAFNIARAIEAKIMEKIGEPFLNWTFNSVTVPLYKLPEVKG